MSAKRITVVLERRLLARLDRAVRRGRFGNRSQAIREALLDKLDRLERTCLARECAKLDPNFEKQLAEEGMAEDSKQWPEY